MEVESVVAVVWCRSFLRMYVVRNFFGFCCDWCMSWCCVMLCVAVVSRRSAVSSIYNGVCCNGGHGG